MENSVIYRVFFDFRKIFRKFLKKHFTFKGKRVMIYLKGLMTLKNSIYFLQEDKDMMTREVARETLGLASYDTPLREALEAYRTAEVRLMEVTKNKDDRSHINMIIRAINTLLKLKDYDEE